MENVEITSLIKIDNHYAKKGGFYPNTLTITYSFYASDPF